MVYAKFDDGFADHTKHKGLSDGAFRLHVSGILHCSRWLTDGHIVADDIPDLMRRTYKPRYLAELVERGIWLEIPATSYRPDLVTKLQAAFKTVGIELQLKINEAVKKPDTELEIHITN